MEKIRCEMLTWNQVVKYSKKLAMKIKDSGYKPHVVIAIGRGGYVPARIICDHLIIKDLTSVKVEHWGTAVKERKRAIIKFPLCTEIKDKRVLLVDDVTETSDTLKVTLDYLKSLKPKEIRTAVVIHKISSPITPDYFARKIIKWRWVIFPWHAFEDIVGFVKKIRDSGINREDDIIRELKKRYNIEAKADIIKEALSFCL